MNKQETDLEDILTYFYELCHIFEGFIEFLQTFCYYILKFCLKKESL